MRLKLAPIPFPESSLAIKTPRSEMTPPYLSQPAQYFQVLHNFQKRKDLSLFGPARSIWATSCTPSSQRNHPGAYPPVSVIQRHPDHQLESRAT
jgi:hypothetical protein